jgi:hypothetical protein
MRAARQTVLVVILLAAVSVVANGEWLRLTTGVTAVYSLWQTSPRRFADETYWGGIGIEALYRSISFGAAVTLADLETFRITDDPGFDLAASLTFFRSGAAGLRLRAGTVFSSRHSWASAYISLRAFWDVLPFTTVHVWFGYQAVVVGAPGANIFLGAGTSLYLPLL